MAVLFYLSEKYLFSSVPYQKLCVFASLADEAKGGDGAKSAFRGYSFDTRSAVASCQIPGLVWLFPWLPLI